MDNTHGKYQREGVCVSEYEYRYKRPHQYKSKLIVDGTVDMVKNLKEKEKKSFAEIGSIIGKSRQQISQIYYKSIASGC